MMTFFIVLAAAAQAYLLGSVDTGILVSKYLYHDDVRNHGVGKLLPDFARRNRVGIQSEDAGIGSPFLQHVLYAGEVGEEGFGERPPGEFAVDGRAERLHLPSGAALVGLVGEGVEYQCVVTREQDAVAGLLHVGRGVGPVTRP